MDLSGAFIGAGIAIGVAACGGGIGLGIMMAKALESIARQPESAGRVRPLMFIGIAFIEACVLYALVISLMLATKTSSPAEAAAHEAAKPAVQKVSVEKPATDTNQPALKK